MALVVADSSFYIRELRAGRQPFQEMEAFADVVEWATMGMIIVEVCRGFRDPHVRDRFLSRYSTMVYLPTSNGAWEQVAKLAWNLDRKGKFLPVQDLIIAAHCLRHGAVLLTYDAHFEAISGLKLARGLDELSK